MNNTERMNKIFWDFEENHFKNDGVHKRELNLVFEFADYIDTEKGEDAIADAFGLNPLEDEDREKIQSIKGKFSKGINKFIDENKIENFPFLD